MDTRTTPVPDASTGQATSLFLDEYDYSKWNRLYDTHDVVEKMLMLENTLKYCLEYQTSHGKCNKCKDGYTIVNNYCLKNDRLGIPNCVRYDGKLDYFILCCDWVD